MAAINTAWIDNLTAQINAAPDCRALQQVVNQVQAIMQAQLDAVADQIERLAEMIIAPTNLTQVIAYLAKVAGMYEAQYAQALATQAALLAAYTNLLAAIDNKIASLNCTITPPTPPALPGP